MMDRPVRFMVVDSLLEKGVLRRKQASMGHTEFALSGHKPREEK
jgi:hypothetical protein